MLIPYSNDNNNKNNFPFYSQILFDAFEYSTNLNNTIYIKLRKHILKCKQLYNYIENIDKDLYYLHNDLHAYNVLKSNDKYLAIDPHGIVGNQLFEYAPYIINEFWDIDYNEKEFCNIINLVSIYSNKNMKDLYIATYIHLCLSTIWFLQDKCSNKLLNKNLKILEFLEKKIDIPKNN